LASPPYALPAANRSFERICPHSSNDYRRSVSMIWPSPRTPCAHAMVTSLKDAGLKRVNISCELVETRSIQFEFAPGRSPDGSSRRCRRRGGGLTPLKLTWVDIGAAKRRRDIGLCRVRQRETGRVVRSVEFMPSTRRVSGTIPNSLSGREIFELISAALAAGGYRQPQLGARGTIRVRRWPRRDWAHLECHATLLRHMQSTATHGDGAIRTLVL